MLAKWNPFASGGIARSASQMPVFDDLFTEADSLLKSAFSLPTGWGTLPWPPTDIRETPETLMLTMDLPGYDPKQLSIQIEGDLLTVRSHREEHGHGGAWLRRERATEVARSFVLPSTVDGSKCEARLEHGVLTLTLPKREEARPRTVTVQVQS